MPLMASFGPLPLRGSRGHVHVLRAVRGSARCACWRAAGAAASLPRENPKLGGAGAGQARPTAVERREGRRRGKRTERGGCSRLLVRRLESREAKAKEDRRASIALRRVEQVARWLRGAGWREQVAHRLPTRCCLTRSSWSALFGRCRRCWEPAPPSGQSNSGVVVWARVLPRLAKLGVLLGCHMHRRADR